MNNRILTTLLLCIFLFPALPALAEAPVSRARIMAEYPHDSATSTQGLVYHQGRFYETSGGWRISYLAIVAPATGEITRKQPVTSQYFAEGLDLHDGKLHMLTWQSGAGFIHDPNTLDQLATFSYRTTNDSSEGWGLTNDGRQFIRSSGEARLYFHSLTDFTLIDSILVRDGDHPVSRLNELEYVDGLVYANLWKDDTIAVIEPETGQVKRYIDLSPLRKKLDDQSGVANGIAYDAVNRKLYVTGKHWNKLFEISTK